MVSLIGIGDQYDLNNPIELTRAIKHIGCALKKSFMKMRNQKKSGEVTGKDNTLTHFIQVHQNESDSLLLHTYLGKLYFCNHYHHISGIGIEL